MYVYYIRGALWIPRIGRFGVKREGAKKKKKNLKDCSVGRVRMYIHTYMSLYVRPIWRNTGRGRDRMTRLDHRKKEKFFLKVQDHRLDW